MQRTPITMTLLDAVVPKAITSSTNASPVVVTLNNHGYVTGDIIGITGHATNTAANGTWYITKLTANTFALTRNVLTGNISVGNGDGINTGVMYKMASAAINTEDFMHAIVSVISTASADTVIKFAGSISVNSPDFNATRSATNDYEYVRTVNLQSGAAVAGDTGVTTSGADNQLFEINTNGLAWISVPAISGTAGTVTVKVKLFNNK